MASSKIRQLTYNNALLNQKINNHINSERCFNEAVSVMKKWGEFGYVPTKESQFSAHHEKVQKTYEREVSLEQLLIPHPVRTFDYAMLPATASIILADAIPLFLGAAFNSAMSISEVEIMAMRIANTPRLNQSYPHFADVMQQSGVGALFTTLFPLYHSLKKAPTFTFTKETCAEVDMIDISKGVDSSFLRSPASFAYFSLADSGGASVHDAQTGFHNLEGFYIEENESHSYDFDNATLDALGLDGNLPYRHLCLVFVGTPKDRLMNDTMNKLDVFLQDGMPIDELIQRTASWYRGDVSVSNVEDTVHLGSLANADVDTTLLDTDHNVELLRVALNYLAYLSFADFRRTEKNDRSTAVRGVNAKVGKNRKSAAKKIAGKLDEIIIRSSNPNFSPSLSAGAGGSIGYKKSPHLRRGFIRNQRYGSGDAIYHKPKFIPPTLVAQGGSEEVQSKNYVVKK